MIHMTNDPIPALSNLLTVADHHWPVCKYKEIFFEVGGDHLCHGLIWWRRQGIFGKIEEMKSD